jgi:hypothetical protein
MWTESAKMVTAVQGGQDHLFKSPFLTKKDDPGMPSIQCSINGYNFQKMLCDTGSGVNIMAASHLSDPAWNHVPTTNIHSALDDFKVIDMGEDKYDPPSSLGDRSSAPLKQSSTLEPEKSTCTSPLRRYATILLTLTI